MSVYISNNEDDGLNGVELKMGHPLGKLLDKTISDDVVYLTIPPEMMEEVIFMLQSSIDHKHPFHVLFSGDIKLRNGFTLEP